jgi:predicted phosphodiesterase
VPLFAAVTAAILWTGVLYRSPVLAGTNEQAGELTFFVVSDTHYGLSQTANPEISKLVDKMNKLPGTAYPAEIGGTVAIPRGVLHVGDVTTSNKKAEWNMFVRDYGLTGKDGRLAYPVYETFGNHDGKLVRNGIRDRNKQRIGVRNISDNGLHYSWDWNSVHFVSLGLCPGTVALLYSPEHSMEFLAQDLTMNVGKSGRPVIIMHHFGFDEGHSMMWWSDEWRADYLKLIKNYNVIGIIHGHAHITEIYQWNGIDIYHAPHFRQDRFREDGSVVHGFFVFRITPGELVVVERKWDDTWGMAARKSVQNSDGVVISSSLP